MTLVVESAAISRFRAALDDLDHANLERGLRGGYPRVPFPPYQEFSTTLRRRPERIRNWFKLLLLGQSLTEGQAARTLGWPLLGDLLSLGVLQRNRGRVDTGGLGLVTHGDLYLLTSLDPSYPTCRDQSLTLYTGPSSYRLAAALPTGRRFGSMLDLCSGPGLLAAVMGRSSERLVASELLEPAVAAARFNLALNGLADRSEVLQGDLWTPLQGRRFDLVIANAPFVLTPAGGTAPVFRDGGEDGMRLLRPLIAGLPEHLTPAGWGIGYLEGPGDLRRPFLCDALAAAAAGRLAVDVQLLTWSPIAEIARQAREADRGRAAPAPGLPAALEALGARGYYQMLVRYRHGSGLTVTDAIPRRRR